MASTYERGYSFAGFQSNQPQRPLPGQHVDIELDSIARVLAQHQAQIQALRPGGGSPGLPVIDLPIAGRSLKVNLLSSPAIPQVVGFDQFKAELGLGSGGGSLLDWNDVQNKPIFGNAAQRNVGASTGTVAAGDDPRLVGALQAAQNGSDIPNKGLFRAALGLGAAAVLGVGATAGTVAAGDDPRFAQIGDVSGKVDKAEPQMAKPPIITAVPASAIDQDGVLNLGHLGVDLTGSSYIDTVTQVALDAIASKVANGRGGGTLKFPMGARAKFNTGVSFGADGSISIIGGSGQNRNSVLIRQECATLFNLTNTKSGADSSSQMLVEVGGICVIGAYPDCVPWRIREPEAVNAHDLRYASDGNVWAAAFMVLRNVRTSTFRNMYARNDHGLDTDADIRGVLFQMSATADSTDNHFTAITGQGFNVGFNANSSTRPTIEGTICTSVTLVQCNTGVIWAYTGPAGYTPPQFHYLNGHMNCYKEGIVGSNVADITISNCELEIAATHGYENLSAITLTNVERFDISHNSMVSARPGSLMVKAGTTNVGVFAHNKGIATVTSAVQQYLSPSKNIVSRDNCFAVSGGASLWNGDAARNLQNLNNTAMFNG